MRQLDNIDTFNNASYHGQSVSATVDQLKRVCGTPYYGHPDDKVQHEWTMATEDGTPFTIYDWKEYREYPNDELIEWNIGGKDGRDAIKGMKEVQMALLRYR